MSSHSEFRNPHSALAYSAFRNPHSAIGNKGFTLIEIIILIVMAGILLPAIIVPFATGVRKSGKPELVTTAMYLAHQRMEELMKYKYTNGALNPTVGFVAFPTGVPNYSGENEIVYLADDLSTPSGDVGYKRIIVRVTDPDGDTYNVYSVVAGFPLVGFDAASSYDTDDQYGAGNPGNSLTWSHTISGSNRILIVGVSINNSAGQTVLNPGGVTYAGSPLTLIGVGSRANARVEMWYLVAPATGTNNVVVTLSAGATARFVVGAVSFTNVDQTSPLGTFQSATNNTATASVTVTSVPGELVVGVLAKRNSNEGATVGAGQTEYWNRVTSNATATSNEWGAGSTEQGAASVIISWTFSTARPWAIGAVPLKGI